MDTNSQKKEYGFANLGIAPKLLEALVKRGFTQPTPIQAQAIPIACEGKDVIGIAQTGTGKTIAFGIPMIQRLAKGKGRGLILLPTRELAVQVNQELQDTGKHFGLRSAVVIGGESEGRQLQQLRRTPHIIVATPGRLVDFLERGKVSLADVSVLVLDEADRMFDMGFAPQLKKIMLAVPRQRQTMLFSATMPPEIVRLAKEHMGWPVRIEIAPQGTTADRVQQELYIVPRTQKLSLLAQVLREVPGSAIVFSRTKYGTKSLARKIRSMDLAAAEIHGNRTQAQRQQALEGFKRGTFRILVATDIAARGIDVQDVALVLNYDLPMQAEDYVHRIGRTARAGKTGRAISFATPEQAKDVKAIERLIKQPLPRRALPQDLPTITDDERERRGERGRRPGSGGERHDRPRGGPYRSARPERGGGPPHRRQQPPRRRR
ncbi:MAG: DEAD/DEAH box helicase [bacterium]|nr:DEAD/DEAH box helicase [bacterium]